MRLVFNMVANSRWNFTGFMRTMKINMTWTTTIPNPKSEDRSTEKTTPSGSQTSSQTSSQRIVELIQENNKITTQRMADILGISRRSVAKAIAKLQERGVIRRVGGDFGGHWEIIESNT